MNASCNPSLISEPRHGPVSRNHNQSNIIERTCMILSILFSSLGYNVVRKPSPDSRMVWAFSCFRRHRRGVPLSRGEKGSNMMQAAQTANGFRTLKAGLLKAALMNLGFMRHSMSCQQSADQISTHTDTVCNLLFCECASLLACCTG